MPINLHAPPPAEFFEPVACYFCGSENRTHKETAQEDLTGKPGDFTFVTCTDCGLVYQHPRLTIEHIKDYYDDEYIAHRKEQSWGLLTPFFEWLMTKLDRDKDAIVQAACTLAANTRVLDVGCGAGGFLAHIQKKYGCECVGVDFKDMSTVIESLSHGQTIDFRCGTLAEVDLQPHSFDLITMWHFLEHDYDPLETLRLARTLLKPGGQMVIEVPRLDSVSYSLYRDRWPGWQAPQHTIALDKERFLRMMDLAGLKVIDYLPYGAYPGYFYMYAGLAFKRHKGKGLDLSKSIYTYLLGQIVTSPVMIFERQLNLSMQTIVCRAED
jgi:2-polyprenyl-3-methyl-5-hydroxy-6-metoxy-1,4-benzoquinol methylase